MHNNERAWWTIAQAAAHYQISKRTIYGKLADGSLKGYRVGRLVRLKPDEVEAALVTSYAD